MQSQETWDLLVGDGRWPDCFPSRSLMCNMQVVMRSSEVTSWLRYSMMPGCTCWTKKRPRLCSYRDPLAGRWGGWRGSGQEHKLDTLEPGALCDSQPFPAAAGWEAPTPKIAPRIMICLLEMTSLWTALNYSAIRLAWHFCQCLENSSIPGSLDAPSTPPRGFLNVYAHYAVRKHNYSFFFKEVYDRR